MNERIRDLAFKAAENSNWKPALGNEHVAEYMEKFAELLIKQTMQVVAKNVAWNGYLNAAEAVIDHFEGKE